MWKILTVQIRVEIYDSIISRWFFPVEQKGCCKWTRGIGELMYIDQHILNKSKTRWKNQVMAGIDYKKAYGMVPQRWIINCLKMYKISDEVKKFIEKSMRTWRVELTAGGRSFAEAKIQSGIFLGDTLSRLLFVIAMVPLKDILRKYTGRCKKSRTLATFEWGAWPNSAI